MAKKLSMELGLDLQNRVAEKKSYNVEIDGEEIEIKVFQKINASKMNYIMSRFLNYMSEFAEEAEEQYDTFFSIALLEGMTDVEFFENDLNANMLMLDTMRELNLLEPAIDLIPQEEIDKLINWIAIASGKMEALK